MKFKLERMTDINLLLGHAVIETIHLIDEDYWGELLKRRDSMTAEEATNHTVELKMTLDGRDMPVEAFFKNLDKQIAEGVDRKVRELMTEKISKQVEEVTDIITAMEKYAQEKANEIKLDVEEYKYF